MSKTASSAKESLSILIVEDHSVFARSIKNSLGDHIFYFAKSVEEAIDSYQSNMPDITFLDINLPDGSGLDALYAIRVLDPSAYVVMLTGSSQKEDVLKSKELAANGYILKPITKQKLADQLYNYFQYKDLLEKQLLEDPTFTQQDFSQEISKKPEPSATRGANENAIMEKVRVLLVERYDANRYNLAKEIKKLGCNIDAVADAEEAVKYIKSNPYHAILIDCNLEGSDGYDLTDTIRKMERGGECSLHYIVGFDTADKKENRWLVAGMNAYFEKPITVSTIRQLITGKAEEWVSFLGKGH